MRRDQNNPPHPPAPTAVSFLLGLTASIILIAQFLLQVSLGRLGLLIFLGAGVILPTMGILCGLVGILKRTRLSAVGLAICIAILLFTWWWLIHSNVRLPIA